MLFVALPHGVAMGKMAELREKAPIVIDLSADFRLRNPADYPNWYGHEHQEPELLDDSSTASRSCTARRSGDANLISSAGCMATTAILGLYPLYRAGVVDLPGRS